jgi:predicted MFS family arabinose efflux permease
VTKLSFRTGAGLVLVAGFFVLFVGAGGRLAIGLILRPMVDDLAWTRTDVGLAVALFQIVSAGCMFVAGHLSDRAGSRLVLSSGVLLGAIGIGLMAVVSAPWHALVLYGLVFAIGNGAASLTPVGVMVTRAFPLRTGLANAVVMSGMTAGHLVIIAALAAVLADIGWRAAFVLLGIAHLMLLPLVLTAIPAAATEASVRRTAAPEISLSLRDAARTRQFWLLLGVYAICGFDDFFVTTHVAAFAQDKGFDAFVAGNLLALMGLAALLGVLAAGAWGDRSGPMWATAATFAVRILAFALLEIDQSALSVTIFALVFGATFLVTAPLAVLFVRESFGTRHLGALTGFITMVHNICGGLGAYLGAAVFDDTGGYDLAFQVMLIVSMLALVLTLCLSHPRSAQATA